MHQEERKPTTIKLDIVGVKKSRKMFEEINREEFVTSPESLQKSDVERSDRDNEERMTTAIENLME